MLCGRTVLQEDIPMAENKQYIMQVQDNGRVLISEDVIASIAAQSLTDIEGFVTLSNKPGAEFADIIGKKNWGKGIRVYISEKNEVVVECNVVVAYGCVVHSVAEAMQEAVLSAVSSVTGIQLEAVNINICGIVRK